MIKRPLTTLAILASALVVAGTIAVASGVPVDEILVLLGVTLLASLIASVFGGMALRIFRGRPVRVQMLVVALSAVLVAVTGVVAAALAMFISRHDLMALVIVLVVSTGVAVGSALQLGDDIDTGTREVGDLARTMVGDGGAVAMERPATMTGPGELVKLATELAAVSDRLEESQQRERALEASRRELIAWVSHDLRAPLATIRAMAEALDDDVVDDHETIVTYQRQIRSDAERLTELVEDLFELSRINSGAVHLGAEKAGLADVVADAVAGTTSSAEIAGVELVERIGELPPIEVSAREFSRALENVLDNALRHTPGGGSVVVEAGTVGGAAVVCVSDECGGIPEDDLPRVFDVAFRGDDARRRDARGGGLGLAITRGLVEAHAGSVSVANQARGCRFTIRVPDDATQAREATETERAGVPDGDPAW
ncbi:sensor histidine kinase [Actinobacteria bacterium YIM 96077]|uniref:histidine kinase n=1 Tax=Phytoactinopolyspora halophila TaxID=1981511 RepID=A0A329QNZ8_9ACTN|nr:HAMP domain-containing sensor histidine kinase [Phytoactinopolyspora halophila]AYY14528.1 sensor histidine kinase [Actinobacteria bacterium YIM 96077]RAW14094.1 two-component sensor histidine kinase [Phytoactinopolyspora halophila]